MINLLILNNGGSKQKAANPSTKGVYRNHELYIITRKKLLHFYSSSSSLRFKGENSDCLVLLSSSCYVVAIPVCIYLNFSVYTFVATIKKTFQVFLNSINFSKIETKSWLKQKIFQTCFQTNYSWWYRKVSIKKMSRRSKKNDLFNFYVVWCSNFEAFAL